MASEPRGGLLRVPLRRAQRPGVAAFGQLILGASLALYDGLGRNSSTCDRVRVFDEAEAVKQAFRQRYC